VAFAKIGDAAAAADILVNEVLLCSLIIEGTLEIELSHFFDTTREEALIQLLTNQTHFANGNIAIRIFENI
jgi:hypothetical protein